MDCPEATFCRMEEYRRNEKSRKSELELNVDELYLVMFALGSDTDSGEAAKLPGKVRDLEKNDSGIFVVKLSLLNKDFSPTLTTNAQFSNGYWTDVNQKVSIKNGSNESYSTKGSYLKTYEDTVDGILQQIGEGIVLDEFETSRELVPTA